MKFRTSVLSGVLALACAPAAFAADTVDLSVTGTIVPTACTPTFSGGGVVDLGQINASALKATGETQFNVYNASTLDIDCSGQVKFAIRTVDNRAGTEAGAQAADRFGLGVASGGEKIGHFSLAAHGIKLDGVSNGVHLLSNDGGATWVDTWSDSSFQDSSLRAFTVSAYAPESVQHASMSVMADVWIADRSTLPLSTQIDIDGNVTFEVVYL
ncbi:DUF1120 domain-containing protein [Lysobacter sp. GCM10012299]|uniref:DUF1120 domain-containing protein n=1 Tax=Lysobacter sp. GCM10012299 TaxID=3317333 RepID=UPI00360B69E8